MKTIRYTLLMLLACLSLNSCQDVEEPVNTVPTVVTDAVGKYSGNFAYVTGTVTSRAECYFQISTSEDMSDARKIEAYPSKNEEKGNWTCGGEVGDLIPGTTYYVVLCATDGRSEVKGNVVSFTTSAYLTIESVKVDGKEFSWDLLGTYLANANQYINPKYGNMRAVRSGNSGYKLPYDIILTESSYRIYTYAPYDDGNSAETLNEIVVKTGGTNDYLYGSCEVTPSNPNANIEMKSALARLHFIISTDSKEPISIDYINLRNVNQQTGAEALSISGRLDLVTGKITPIPIPGHDGIIMNMPNTPIYTGVQAKAEMLVIPTSFKDGEIEIGVSVNSQLIQTTIPTTTWEAGKTYEIPLKINETSTNKAKIGDYYYSDGTYSSTYYSAANSNKVCIGIVFALSKEQGGDIDVSLSSSEHGRIVALEDIGTSRWGTQDNVYDGMIFHSLYEESCDYGYLPIDGKSQYSSDAQYCQISYNFEQWLKLPEKADYKNYALCDYKGADWTHYFGYGDTAAAMCYNNKVGNVEWFLPSVGELSRFAMANEYGKISEKKQTGFHNPKGEYWTSCAVLSTMAWAYTFETGRLGWVELITQCNVRPVASF